MKRRPSPAATTPASSVPAGSLVRYPDGRLVTLTADLCGGRMGRVEGGELSNWISAETPVEVVRAYEPRIAATNTNTDTDTDPLIAGGGE